MRFFETPPDANIEQKLTFEGSTLDST